MNGHEKRLAEPVLEDGGTQRRNDEITGEIPAGLGACPEREAYKGETENADPMLAGKSEVVIVPAKVGRTDRRKGPLLSPCVQNEERWPECPREGRLEPGVSTDGAKRSNG